MRAIQQTSYLNALYAFVILGTCVAWTCTFTIIPVHNIFEHPEFWWENIFLSNAFFALFVCTSQITWVVYLIFGEDLSNPKIYPLKYFTAYYTGVNITYLGIYFLWKLHMGYNFPMPFIIVPCVYIANFSRMLSFGLNFPAKKEAKRHFEIGSWHQYSTW